MFADIALAQRIERAECRLLAGAAAAARGRGASGAFAQAVAGGVATYTRPGSPLNKLAGLGFEGPVAEAELAAVEQAFAERGAPVQAEVASLGDPSVGQLLTRRGYVLRQIENVLGCPLPAAHEDGGRPGIRVVTGEAVDPGTWFDVLHTGFTHPDGLGVPSHEDFPREVMEQTMGDITTQAGLHCYLAYREGAVAGAARLSAIDGVAGLGGGATLPEHRGHGVHRTLVARRLRDASDLGCDLAVVTTQPGSRSQENAGRQGFALLYTRAILVREA